MIRYQAGLLALVSDDMLAQRESEPFMLDYSDVLTGRCDFRLKGPNASWSTPVSVAGMSAGGLVEMEQDWSHQPGNHSAYHACVQYRGCCVPCCFDDNGWL